jgi:hypothetical protein
MQGNCVSTTLSPTKMIIALNDALSLSLSTFILMLSSHHSSTYYFYDDAFAPSSFLTKPYAILFATSRTCDLTNPAESGLQ